MKFQRNTHSSADQTRSCLHHPALAPALAAHAPDPSSSFDAPRTIAPNPGSPRPQPRRARDLAPPALAPAAHTPNPGSSSGTPDSSPVDVPKLPSPDVRSLFSVLPLSLCVWVTAERASILQHHGRTPKNGAHIWSFRWRRFQSSTVLI
jgi:hypothetical protein